MVDWGSGERGRAGSNGRVTRKEAALGELMEPLAPYKGAVNSGTSSTYWYSSTEPEVLVMTPPLAAESTILCPSVPYPSSSTGASSTGA